MKVAIHHRKSGFSQKWIDYCEKNRINFKLVNCYQSDIVQQLSDCDALMWHFHHANPKDILFAKQLLFSLETSGKLVFPDFHSSWHFDDKVGQKYLLESINAPLVNSYVFYSKEDAMNWIEQTTFPKVFKLRGGASSGGVRLVKNRTHAVRLVNKAFGTGFRQYDPYDSLKEIKRKYKSGGTKINDLIEGIGRFVIRTDFEKTVGNERGYIYFQDFIPDNTDDIRVTFVHNKCFASRRKVRPGDFRASGSGLVDWDVTHVPEKALEIAFDVSHRLKLQTGAFDFVLLDGEPLIVEMSYAFGYHPNHASAGYWDHNLTFHPGAFDPYGWMVEIVIDALNHD